MSDQSIYFSWRRNNPKELAQFVARSLPPELRLDKGINRADLLKSAGNRGLVRELYGLLSQLAINYDVEPPDITPGIQQLRPPRAILAERRGTCVDLALLFCSVCLANDLYPLLVAVDGHAFAAFQTEGRLQDLLRPMFGVFDDAEGMLTDQETLRSLMADGIYTFIECTGYAISRNHLVDTGFPEGQRNRDRGIMSFEEALSAGQDQVERFMHTVDTIARQPRSRALRFVLDIYSLQEQYGFTSLSDAPPPPMTVTLAMPADRESIPQPPTPSAEYIPRIIEQELRDGLIHADDLRPITILYGLPGTGKSTVAEAVVAALFQEGFFPGGVLWIDANRPEEELAAELLSLLGPRWNDATRRPTMRLFWQVLGARQRQAEAQRENRRSLVVLANIDQPALLMTLQPQQAMAHRILVLSNQPLEHDQLHVHMRCAVGEFSAEEVKTFFQKRLPKDLFEGYPDDLATIGTLLGRLPQSLSTAARILQQRNVTPRTYRRQIEQSPVVDASLLATSTESLNMATRDLNDEQKELLYLTTLFGDYDWSMGMLAAVALVPLARIQAALELLVGRDIIRKIGSRYQVQRLYIQGMQQHHGTQRGFQSDASYHLMARYCLDVAQRQAVRLAARQERQPYKADGFYRAFRTALQEEMPHIRRVLTLAYEYDAWEIIQRFAYLPHANIVENLAGDYAVVVLNLRLATITRFLLAPSESGIISQPPNVSLAATDSLAIRRRLGTTPVMTVGNISGEIQSMLKLLAPVRTELYLDLCACLLIDSIVIQADILQCHLVGVRAPDSVWKQVEFIGAQLIACDLSGSIWSDCDGSQSVLTRSVFNNALLEGVRLRGADLQHASFRGCRLHDVDLRGADLRGADFTGAQLWRVKLFGAQLEGVVWSTAIIEDLLVEEEILRQIRQAAGSGSTSSIEQLYGYALPLEIRRQAGVWRGRLDLADLRAVDLSQAVFEHTELIQADLRLANITGAKFRGANLQQADLRGAYTKADPSSGQPAQPTMVEFSSVNLQQADLRGVNLPQARFEKSRLREANLSFAQLDGAQFPGADLSGIDLRASSLKSANLEGADLTGANMIGTDLTGARLSNAILINAKLTSAWLNSAVLTGALLTGADCVGANFHMAQVSDEQLVTTSDLHDAILRGGEIAAVETLNEAVTYASEVPRPFRYLTGRFTLVGLAGCFLFGATLAQQFVGANCRMATLTHARLDGRFQNAHFDQAQLNHAHLRGDYADATFCNANLRGTFFERCSLVRVDLTGATGLSDAQLRNASRLRGAKLANGRRYRGQFHLPGDLADARAAGVDLHNQEALRIFYKTDSIDRQDRQEQFTNLLDMVRAQLNRLATSNEATAAALEFSQQLQTQLARFNPNLSLVKVTGAGVLSSLRQLEGSLANADVAVQNAAVQTRKWAGQAITLAIKITEMSANQSLVDELQRLASILDDELQSAANQHQDLRGRVTLSMKRLLDLALSQQSEPLLIRQLSASIVSDIAAVTEISETALVLSKKIEWLMNHVL